MATSTSDHLDWEVRAGRFAAGAAIGSAVLFVAGGIYLQLALDRRPSASNELLAEIGREATAYIVTGALTALAVLALGAVIWYLYRATRARREQLPSAAFGLLVFGSLAAAGVALARPIDLIALAGDVPSAALRSTRATDELLRDRTSLQVVSGLALAANLALAFALILVSLNAMRAGLLSRFLGVLGIVIGVLLPLVGPMPVLLFFWLVALAALFVDRWPGGRGPAWSTGEATPWPTVAQRNAEIDRRRIDELEAQEREAEGPSDEPDAAATAATTSSNGARSSAPRSKKRKRGRR